MSLFAEMVDAFAVMFVELAEICILSIGLYSC